MTSYHVSVLYDTSIGMGCPNNGAQFNKCVLRIFKVRVDKTVTILTQYTTSCM